MKKSTKTFRSVMCGLLAFLLSVSLVLISGLAVLKTTVLSADNLVSVVNKSNYSEALQDELKNSFISHGAACNIDESFFDKVFEDIVTVEQIDKDTEKSIRAFYNNQFDTQEDYSELESKLFDSLMDYASSKGYALNEEIRENLTTISQELVEIYVKFVAMFNASYFKTAADLLSRYSPAVNYAIIGISIFALLDMLIICLSFAKAKNRLRFLIYAFSSASLMLLVAPAGALIMGVGNKINIANASLYSLVSGFINSIFIAFIVAAIIMAVITAVLHVIRIRLDKSKK